MVYTMLPRQSTNRVCKEKWGLEKKSAVIYKAGTTPSLIYNKAKLRLNLWHEPGRHKCPMCGMEVDKKGDHYYRCNRVSKTPMHDKWRDGIKKILEDILPLVKLIRSPTTVRDEQKGLVRKLKNTRFRPADISFRIDHYLGESEWRTSLQRLLFDVTTTSSVTKPVSLSDDARLKENNLHLQRKERDKFQRKGHTNKKTNITMTGEDIMRDHNNRHYGFVPIVISPYGKMGNMAERFFFGADPLPLPDYTKPQALKAAKVAISLDVPFGVLNHAKKLWRQQHEDETYGSNYKDNDPLTSATKQLGRLICVSNGEHLLTAIDKMNGEPIPLDERPTGDGASDWAGNESETDAVLCSETAGYASLLTFASTDTQEVSQSGRDDEERSFEESFDTALGTSSSPTDTSAMM